MKFFWIILGWFIEKLSGDEGKFFLAGSITSALTYVVLKFSVERLDRSDSIYYDSTYYVTDFGFFFFLITITGALFHLVITIFPRLHPSGDNGTPEEVEDYEKEKKHYRESFFVSFFGGPFFVCFLFLFGGLSLSFFSLFSI